MFLIMFIYALNKYVINCASTLTSISLKQHYEHDPMYLLFFVENLKNNPEGEGEGGMIWENGNSNMYTVM